MNNLEQISSDNLEIPSAVRQSDPEGFVIFQNQTNPPLRWLVIERKVLPSRSSWCSDIVPEPYIACSKPLLQWYNGNHWVAVPEVHEKEYD